jgi:hypothetical protein
MTLYLIPLDSDTVEKVGAPVDVKERPRRHGSWIPSPVVVMTFHFYPFPTEGFGPPLPPLRTAYASDAAGCEIVGEDLCCFGDVLGGDGGGDFVHPLRNWNEARCECL